MNNAKQKLSRDVVAFLEKEGLVIISTLDQNGAIHCSAKGIVGIEPKGKVFLIDLYFHATFKNLKENATVTITAVNEKEFKGFSLQGKAKIVPREDIKDNIIEAWEDRIIRRVTSRLIDSVQKGLRSKKHFEMDLPKHPKYLIEIDVDKVIDLRPPTIHK